MTSKEALDIFGKIPHKNGSSPVLNYDLEKAQEAYKILNELVERDTPKKVVKEVDKKYVDTYEFYERDIYRCGSCNKVLIVDKYQILEDRDKINYCKECGQRLDWSELENDK